MKIRNEVKQIFEELSSKLHPYDYHILHHCLVVEMKKAGLDYSDIGANEEELKRLGIKNFKAGAINSIYSLRKASSFEEKFFWINCLAKQVNLLRKAEADNLGFSFSFFDINTTEEEFESLVSILKK